MKKRFSYLILPLIALVLEIMPYGAVLIIKTPAVDPSGNTLIDTARRLYSYFDTMPLGWGNFSPMVTALLTCVILLQLVLYCFTGKPQLASSAKIFLLSCALFSIGPILFMGFRYYSMVAALITLLLIAEFAFLHITIKKYP